MEKRLEAKIDKIASTKSTSFAQTTAKQVGETNKLMRKITSQIENKTIDKGELQERTLLVRKYKDKNMTNSMKIRKFMKDKFPQQASSIELARTTAAGSILIEFDNKEAADEVKSNWNQEYLGGNVGVVKANERSPIGIVKHVDEEDYSQEEITDEICNSFPSAECEYFKKNDKFMGIIKVKFKSTEELDEAMANKISIFNQKYKVERYIAKRRIIRCMKCQIFGHIARLCTGKTVCGKCSSKTHETKDCNAPETEYKCFHCKGNHMTGDKTCQVIIEKWEELNPPA